MTVYTWHFQDREETAARALSELQAEAEEDSRLRAEKKKEKSVLSILC
jgi:hypothetical protein